jgi:hypothetical protein
VLLLRLKSSTHHTVAAAFGLAGRAAVVRLAVAMLTGLAGMALLSTSAAVVVVGVGVLHCISRKQNL